MAKKSRKAPVEEPALVPWRVDPERLKKARKDAALSQIEVAVRSKTSIRMVSSLECGLPGSPELAKVGAIADVLGVGVDWLCGRAK